MKIYLVRHGMTEGNKEKRYIGRTDEALCKEGIEQIKLREYPKADIVYVSPMKRCVETAELIYPEHELRVCELLKEMDFGDFEGKNYEELKDEPDYVDWLESGGKKPFPHGEGKGEFAARCVRGFECSIQEIKEKEQKVDISIIFVVHGGTIMAIMEKYGEPKGEYYHWQIANGEWIELTL